MQAYRDGKGLGRGREEFDGLPTAPVHWIACALCRETRGNSSQARRPQVELTAKSRKTSADSPPWQGPWQWMAEDLHRAFPLQCQA